MEHLKYWVNNLMDSLETEVDEETSRKIIEKCGRICAKECGAINKVEEIKNNQKCSMDIDILLEKMNQAGIGGGKLKREGSRIYGIYEKCYCPSRSLISNNNYCTCTQGWVKEVFEKVLEKSVDVTLEQAIARGDKICKFRVEY